MRIEIPEPCSEDWAEMSPADRGRLCAKCRTTVHELSRYTPEEAEALISDGQACIRAEVLPGGRVATRPSHLGRVLLAAMAAPALLALGGCMQGKPSTAVDDASANSSAPAADAGPVGSR